MYVIHHDSVSSTGHTALVGSDRVHSYTFIPCSVSYMSSELTLQAFTWATSSNVHLGYLSKRSPGPPHQASPWVTSYNVHLGYLSKRSPGLPHQTFTWTTSSNVPLGYLSKRSPGLPQQTFTWATSSRVAWSEPSAHSEPAVLTRPISGESPKNNSNSSLSSCAISRLRTRVVPALAQGPPVRMSARQGRSVREVCRTRRSAGTVSNTYHAKLIYFYFKVKGE